MRTRSNSRRTHSNSRRTRGISRRALGIVLAFIGSTLLLSVAFHTSTATPTAQAHVAAGITPPPFPSSFPSLHPVAVTGIPAIQRSGNTVTMLAQQDVTQYVNAHLIPPRFQASGTPSLAKTNLLTNPQLGALLRENTGLPDNAQVYYVELHGSFSVVVGPNQVLTYPVAYEVFDANTGDLLMEGLLPQAPTPPTPTPVPTKPTPTPTQHVTPVINVSITPQSTKQSCSGLPLPSWTLTIDNTKSNVAESWTISFPEQDPATKSGTWASASPSSGTAPAGGKSKVTITPNSDLCPALPYSQVTRFHVQVTWPISGGSKFQQVPDDIQGLTLG